MVLAPLCYSSVKDVAAYLSSFPGNHCLPTVCVCVYSVPVENNSVLSPRSVASGHYGRGTVTLNGSHSITHGVSTLGNAFLFPSVSVQGIVWVVLVMYRMSLFKHVAKFLLFACGIISLLTCTLPVFCIYLTTSTPILLCDEGVRLLIITFHGGSSTTSSARNGSRSVSLRHKPTKRANNTINQTDDHDSLDGRPPKKRGRPSMYLPSQPCGPCSVWLQSGRDVRLAQYHRSNPIDTMHKQCQGMYHNQEYLSSFNQIVVCASVVTWIFQEIKALVSILVG